ncbi:hypothetical protein OSB04_un001024 [Centaurea solstitialis]|uniref:Uncharacterized protein n=1 Tax=Centaurea solstitialis TaxID=347529 RepID=A0AA38SPF0_9ASTR|nr:hypothetical protein OSB04_un001024 [Centaurea solstitialis]
MVTIPRIPPTATTEEVRVRDEELSAKGKRLAKGKRFDNWDDSSEESSNEEEDRFNLSLTAKIEKNTNLCLMAKIEKVPEKKVEL